MTDKYKIIGTQSITSDKLHIPAIVDNNQEVERGDIVVTTSTKNGEHDIRVARVTSVFKTCTLPKPRVHYLESVITDSSPLFKSIKKRMKKARLKEQINERINKLDTLDKVKLYAKSDENIAKLVKELESLN